MRAKEVLRKKKTKRKTFICYQRETGEHSGTHNEENVLGNFTLTRHILGSRSREKQCISSYEFD